MSRSTGFTLVELLIVIGILGILAAALLPNLVGAGTHGQATATLARLQYLAEAAKSFERSAGYYPPDDCVDPEGKLKCKTDDLNAGIESLVFFLGQKRRGADSLADHEDWLKNTDEDDTGGSPIVVLDRTKKMEVVDAWGVPLVYFNTKNGGKAHRVRLPSGDDVKISPVKNPRTGKVHGADFQLVSAGPDGLFGTEDDLTYPPIVRD